MNVDLFRNLRVALNCPARLSDVERDALDASYRVHRWKLSRSAWKYYAGRTDDVNDATSWLVSETYTYVIDSVIAGRIAIPTSEREWIATAKTIRHRYYASREVVIDGGKAKFLGDDDTSVATIVNADRLRLDDDAFIAVLCDYACAGLGRSRKVTSEEGGAPQWVVDTITHWVTAPEVSWADRAAELGIERNALKWRESKCKAAVRAGIVGDLITID